MRCRLEFSANGTYVSSRLIKGCVQAGGDVRALVPLVPPLVMARMRTKTGAAAG